jgi:AraC-like DNA-binding protein
LAREICAAWLRLLLLKLRGGALPTGRAAPRSLATFVRVRRHIEEHYLRLRTVEEIARECHVTPMYAARLFRRFAHTGTYQFLLRLKMNRAAELLLDRGLLVKEAADELGFADAFHFSRLFKRVHGFSPGQFVARQR